MKIAIASDLHLEFGDIDLKNTENADVLILAGDICVAEDLYRHTAPIVGPDLGSRQQSAVRYRNFFRRVSQEFPQVIYIAGNHEYYHGKWPGFDKVLKDEMFVYGNIHFLQNDFKVVQDVTILGSTLWTSMDNCNPVTLHAVGEGMNDFHVIKNDKKGYTKLRPAHVAEAHRRTMDYFRIMLEGKFDQKFIVVTHHAPSHLSIHDMYRGQALNAAYYTDLSDFILERPQIKLWVHGHVHHNFDYQIGDTRVVCNPRGYVGYEVQDGFFNLQYVTV